MNKIEYQKYSEPGAILIFFARATHFIWKRLPIILNDFRISQYIGKYFYNHYTRFQSRDQSHSTWFLRNVPQTKVLVGLIKDKKILNEVINIASIGCSTGAELYSNLFVLKSMCSEKKFESVGVDISAGVVEIAKNAIYSTENPSSLGVGNYYEGEFELSHLDENDMAELFDPTEKGMKIKSWISNDTSWQCMSASDDQLVRKLGKQDIVFAKNFLGPMDSDFAQKCLLND